MKYVGETTEPFNQQGYVKLQKECMAITNIFQEIKKIAVSKSLELQLKWLLKY